MGRRVVDERAGKVALNTANKVVVLGVGAFRDDTEGVVLSELLVFCARKS